MDVSNRLNGPDVAYRSFLTAIRHVTKSGEVWCEGARVFLDPSSKHFFSAQCGALSELCSLLYASIRRQLYRSGDADECFR